AAGGAARIAESDRAALEHQPVPLPQSRLGLRARARGRAGAAGRARGLREPPRGALLRVLGRDRQPRVPAVPRRLASHLLSGRRAAAPRAPPPDHPTPPPPGAPRTSPGAPEPRDETAA